MLVKIIVGVSFFIFMFSGCVPVSSGNYSHPKPPKEEKVDNFKKVKYENLKKEKEATEKYINDLEGQKSEAHENIMNVGSFGRGNIKGGPSQYDSPQNQLEHNQQIYDITSNQLIKEHEKLRRIYDDMARLLNESKKSCFPKDIKVLTSKNGYVNISDIKVGDKVLVYNIAKDEISDSFVKDKYVDTNNHYYKINNSMEATAFERFLTKDGWKITRELTVSDMLFNGNSYEKITSIEKIERNLNVYNLHIDSSHNFFVSKDGNSFLLIHNTGGGGGGDK